MFPNGDGQPASADNAENVTRGPMLRNHCNKPIYIVSTTGL